MSPKSAADPRKPPEPPPHARRLEFAPTQLVGMLALAALVVLAVSGVGFDSGEARDWIWRVTFVYLFLMIAFRVTGKREVGQMSPFELVTLLLIPEIFSPALNRSEDSLSLATLSVVALFLLVFVTGLVSFRFRKVETLISGEPTILVRDGKPLERNLSRERVTLEEVFTEMHLSGIERLEDVRWAILETEGKISIIPATASPQRKKDTSR